jgi:hypothetical protein
MVETEIEFKILEIFEKGGLLRVITECKYGKDNMGLSLEQKYINPVTNEPRFMDEVRDLLSRKYGHAIKTEVKEIEAFINKKFKTLVK